MQRVRVVFTKFDGRLHWHAWLDRLGEDEYGVWLGSPTGTVWRRGSEPAVQFQPSVTLVPHGAGWVAAFNTEPAKYEMYVDVCTVPVWDGDEVTMVDLDLDVVRYRADGAVRLLDEDEFIEHQAAFRYPPDLVADATRTAQRLLTDVAGAEPFVSAYRPWLARVSEPAGR